MMMKYARLISLLALASSTPFLNDINIKFKSVDNTVILELLSCLEVKSKVTMSFLDIHPLLLVVSHKAVKTVSTVTSISNGIQIQCYSKFINESMVWSILDSAVIWHRANSS